MKPRTPSGQDAGPGGECSPHICCHTHPLPLRRKSWEIPRHKIHPPWLVTGTLGPTPTRGPLHPTGHIVPSPSPDKRALTHHSPSCSIFSCLSSASLWRPCSRNHSLQEMGEHRQNLIRQRIGWRSGWAAASLNTQRPLIPTGRASPAAIQGRSGALE